MDEEHIILSDGSITEAMTLLDDIKGKINDDEYVRFSMLLKKSGDIIEKLEYAGASVMQKIHTMRKFYDNLFKFITGSVFFASDETYIHMF